MKLRNDREHQQIATDDLLRDDSKFASGKIAFFQYLMVAIFLFLITGFWDLQVRNPTLYQERAMQNSIKAIPVLAPRGKILDRDGRVIVDNHSSFTLYLSRENLKMEHLRPIAEGLNLDYDALVTRVRRFNSRGEPQYHPIPIKEELTPAELAFVDSHKDENTFPELEVIRTQHRLYPRDGLAAHVIGYVGEVSESELNTPEFASFHQGDIIGKDGIEREYNDVLMGTDGQRRVEVDSFGNERRVLSEDKESIPGRTLQLTIDLDLQAVAELTLENRRGAVVALDPRNGEVLAMVSRPAFDPNLFAGRIRSKDWSELVNNPAHPLMNRAIQAQQAPGSTFKPIMLLAGLETGAIDDNFHVNCPGGANFYGRFFKCWGKHGTVGIHEALVHSCDTFFYNVANRMDIDDIARYAEMVGYGHKTGIDLPHEAEGVVPSRKWKIRNFREKWYPGENISVGIGQGATTVTPLQMASAIGGLAVGGMWFQPHLIRDAVHLMPARRAEVNLDNIRKVISGMYGVVNEGGGTGVRAHIPGIDVCGKTGSAQLVSNDALRAGFKQGKDMKDNAWFVGFAPCSAPEIVVATLFENGEHGQLAAPIVRDVIKAYFDKKARLAQPPPQIAALPPQILQPPAPVAAPAAVTTPTAGANP
ncbi:MAG TPA: penicillin-binding protein 2 [Bryobacteraceae bacterium]|nr:penicillin-binding protein 2 [Bryobacteraceae bacterium]